MNKIEEKARERYESDGDVLECDHETLVEVIEEMIEEGFIYVRGGGSPP